MTSCTQNTIIPDPANSSIKDVAEFCTADSAEFFGMTNADDIVQYIMTVLQQSEPSFGIQLHKRLKRMGISAVWSCFQATVPNTTVPHGATRSLMSLLDQCEQETAIR